jgi:hypothetical protein
MEKTKVAATFDKDSRRYHGFVIGEGQQIVGMIYVPRGDEVPDEVIIALKTKAQPHGGEENGHAKHG